MSQLVWNPEWTTGIGSIDEQHHQLLEQFEALLSAIHENRADQHIASLLLFLADYVDLHFRNEEAEMQRTAYPDLARHKAVHDGMRKKVQEQMARFEVEGEAVTFEAIEFMTDWLVEHISSEDRRLARHLLAVGGEV